MTLYFQLAGILSSISMAGAFIIILSYLLTPSLRRHPINLVFFLAIADFFYNLKWVVTSVVQDSKHIQDNDMACILQAVWGQFWSMGSVAWNGIVSLLFYSILLFL